MNQIENQRPTWAEISLPALTRNYQTLKRMLDPGTQLMAVVKADGYGHGAVECASELERTGVDWFGVALVEEGVNLRRSGIVSPIFCLGGFWRGQADDLIQHRLTPAVFRLDAAAELNARAAAAGIVYPYHLKVDTGMGRLGVQDSEVADFARELSKFVNLRMDGLLTHFAEADGGDTAWTREQVIRFEKADEVLTGFGFAPRWKHLANSAGLHAYPESHGNLARAGATLYGLTRDVLADHPQPLDLQPVMSLYSKIVQLKTVPAGRPLGYGRTFVTGRESRIATIPIGYADGLRRAHSNNGRVIVRDRFAPIVGRVSMDLTIIDVTEIDGVQTGDDVTLIGAGRTLRISAEDLAEQIGAISYEIVTGISARVPRIYL
ncbi:MAG: alanine racemase [Acidobacteriota bacterium]|nr:MAG: alanine racemase [Acidobacteriota bacterium]